jgi:16S rRNA (adenine1518-N6/adenine1519-N6)-dimethyltransferase
LNNAAHFASVVAAAFSQRRKTLRNALQGIASPELMKRAGIDPALRAERVAPELFAALANILPAASGRV